MQKINQEATRRLFAIPETPKVTIYIPLEASASPPHITENQIRMKNLINAAVSKLDDMGDISSLSSELKDMLEAHTDDIEFWKDRGRGLLICAASGVLEMFDLPIDTEEYMAVDETFHLAPVLALLGDDKQFYVLCLAQQNPKLFKGDMYGLSTMDVNLPISLRAALGIDEPNQKSENQGSATGLSTNTGWFNGRGGARDPQDNDRLRFFHVIDKILHDKLDRDTPLILAGIDSETVEFRNLSKYPKLTQGSISGNQNDAHLEDIFAKAQEIIVEEMVKPEHTAAREEYERLAGANPDRVAGDKKSIAEAAEQGRIDKLLARLFSKTTDTVQDKVQSVLRITFPEPEFSKNLNSMASKVWTQSGKVLSLLPDEMPGGALMVARLRY